MKTYKDSELQSLLKDVEAEIVSLVKSEKDKLAKAHPGEETSDEVPSDDSATSAPADSAPAESAAPESAPADSAPPSDGPPAPDAASAPPADGPASADVSGDPAADQSADPAALEAEYSKLPPEDLKAHYLACKSALFAIMGAAGPDAGAAPPMAPDAAPPAPDAAPLAPPPAASPSAPPALKSEKTMVKSEKDIQIETLTASLAKSNEGLNSLLSVVETIVSQPKRKAITSTAFIAKSEQASDVSRLSKAEVRSKLKEVAATNLKKSDRELIYGYDAGTVSVEQISHLLLNK